MAKEFNTTNFYANELVTQSIGELYIVTSCVQFKLLILDSFLFYRHVIADDVIPDAKGFGSLNLRLGMGF